MKAWGRVLKGLHFNYGLGFERVYTSGALEIHLNSYHSLFTEALEQKYSCQWYQQWYYLVMAKIKEILPIMRSNPKGVGFNDLAKVCDHYFGKARQTCTGHSVYKTPWQGDPRVNIQNDKGMAKAYQVRQVLKAIERLEAQNDVEK